MSIIAYLDPFNTLPCHFMMFQIGAIYLWSYVYNIVRIHSNKNSEGAKLDDFTESTKSEVETAENLSNSRLGSLLPLNLSSPKEDHLDHLELDRANISEGKPKVTSLSGFITLILVLTVVLSL